MNKVKEDKGVHITILINKVPNHISSSTITADEIRRLADADSDYEVWKVIKSPDPEGQLPVDDIQVTGSIDVKSGDKFRVVPPGTFGAVAEMPQQLFQEIELLTKEGHEIVAHEENGLILLIFQKYPLPAGYNKTCTLLLIKVPKSYPNGKLDMFWTEPDLCLQESSVKIPTTEESILGKKWLRFSWHPQKWNPGRDNLLTFLEFVRRGLLKK